MDITCLLSGSRRATIRQMFFFINLVRMFAWADSQDQSLH